MSYVKMLEQKIKAASSLLHRCWISEGIDELDKPIEAHVDGVELIRLERERQVAQEGWTPEHDDSHDNGEMAWAATCYAAPGEIRTQRATPPPCGCRSVGECTHGVMHNPARLRWKWLDPWPWAERWDKRSKHDRIRQLTIAGALIAAEIDRLRRLRGKQCTREAGHTGPCAATPVDAGAATFTGRPEYNAVTGQKICPHCQQDCGGWCEPGDRKYADVED